MLNHKQPSDAKYEYSDERGGFLVEALEDLAKGVPVQHSYGTKCNSRLFLCYGFVLPDNAANAVPLQVSLSENSTDKLEMLNNDHKLKSQIFQVTKSLSSQADFFSWCRFVSYKGDPADFNPENLVFDASDIKMLDFESEKSMWQLVGETSRAALKKYPTSLEQDRKLLKRVKENNSNRRNCILFRIGEKEVLQFWIETARLMSKWLTTVSNATSYM